MVYKIEIRPLIIRLSQYLPIFSKFVKQAVSMDNAQLYTKLTTLPENMKAEVSDFIDFLLSKNKKNGTKPKAKFGSGKGLFKIKPSFDDPLEDFKEYRH